MMRISVTFESCISPFTSESDSSDSSSEPASVSICKVQDKILVQEHDRNCLLCIRDCKLIHSIFRLVMLDGDTTTTVPFVPESWVDSGVKPEKLVAGVSKYRSM
jgi:hypothetical protein